MLNKKWAIQLSLTCVCLVLGLLLAVQLRTQNTARQTSSAGEWEYVVADLIDSNARLKEETATLESQLAQLDDTEGRGAVLQSLVAEVNHLRIANGLVEVSGPGVQVVIDGPISVLDMQDLINELRNASSEALALNGHRLVAWSAIGSDGESITVDGLPLQAPYLLEAIGDAHTLEVALVRPGGLVTLLQQAREDVRISVEHQDKLTLSVYTQPFQFVYAKPVN
jgi:uncharacterized protein YlxW (UPF0749 family)